MSAACRCGALCVQLWAARKAEAYQAGEKAPSAIDLHRELNRLKQTDYPWLYETSKCAPQEALRDLDVAFAHFFRRVALKKAGQLTGKVGYPRFKSRKAGHRQFQAHRRHQGLCRVTSNCRAWASCV